MRRAGWRGYVGAFRGVVRDGDDVAFVRSPRIAEQIAVLLTGARVATGRYSAGRSAVGTHWPVYAATDGRFGSGVVALATSERFATSLAGALNGADPAEPPPVERGGRWF